MAIVRLNSFILNSNQPLILILNGYIFILYFIELFKYVALIACILTLIIQG